MSPRRTPKVTALLDQLDAAGDHAVRDLTGLAALLGGQLTEQSPPPALRRILARLDTRLKADQFTMCHHLSPRQLCRSTPGRNNLDDAREVVADSVRRAGLA